MPQRSAGLLLYRSGERGLELLLIHPGGPFWARKDIGAWSIPKGLQQAGEDALEAARREFEEETGARPEGPFLPLGEFRQPSGKRLAVWAAAGDFDPAALRSNTFRLEWPPRSGRFAEFPEADRAAWFDPEAARARITAGQRPVIAALLQRLGG